VLSVMFLLHVGRHSRIVSRNRILCVAALSPIPRVTPDCNAPFIHICYDLVVMFLIERMVELKDGGGRVGRITVHRPTVIKYVLAEYTSSVPFCWKIWILVVLLKLYRINC